MAPRNSNCVRTIAEHPPGIAISIIGRILLVDEPTSRGKIQGLSIKAHFTFAADMDVAEIYQGIIDDVVSKMAAEFENESVPDHILVELKKVGEELSSL